MVFGLPEEGEEQLSTRVGQIFQEIGEKPRIEASRLGQKCKPGKARPVKVTVSSSTIVWQKLATSNDRRNTARFSFVQTVHLFNGLSTSS